MANTFTGPSLSSRAALDALQRGVEEAVREHLTKHLMAVAKEIIADTVKEVTEDLVANYIATFNPRDGAMMVNVILEDKREKRNG